MDRSNPTPFTGLRGLPEDFFRLSDGHELRVLYIDAYVPTRFQDAAKHEGTKMLLKLKDGDSDGIEYFADKLNDHLGPKLNPTPSFVAVPGHMNGPSDPFGGLRKVIDQIPNVSDLSHCLVRTVAVPKMSTAAQGERLDAAGHIKTMEVRCPEELAGKHLILIDDVITRGSTMRAARYMLLTHAKPASLTCLALTRTRSSAESQSKSAPSASDEIPF